MIFASRSPRSPDRWYRWKALALVTGVGLFLLGIRLQQRWLTWVGTGVLALALVLRVFAGRRGRIAETREEDLQ